MNSHHQTRFHRRDQTGLFVSLSIFLSLSSMLLATSLRAANDTWTGGGSPDFTWTNSANWGGTAPVADDQLFFDGSVGLLNTNTIVSNTEFGGITFNSTAGSFALRGNQLTLANGGGITNSSPLLQTNALGGSDISLAVTNSGIVNYITTPGGGQLIFLNPFDWANAPVTNSTLIFTGASVKDVNGSGSSSFGIGGNTFSVSNTMIFRNSTLDGNNSAGVSNGRRINAANGLANTIIFDNSVATNIDGMIIGNGGSSYGNTLIVSNGSKIYINGTDIYEIGRNTGSQNHQMIITGPGSAVYSGGHAFAIGGSAGNTTNCSVQVNNGALWNLGGSTFRLNFSGPNMSLSANDGTVSNVYSMIIGNGHFSNSMTLGNGSKFNFSAASGDYRELGRGGNANNNTFTATDPNTYCDFDGATFAIGGTASGANNFSNIMTIANGAVFTNGSLTVGGQGSYQQLIVSNATAYINSLILNGGNSAVYLNGGSGDRVFADSLGNNATGILTNTAATPVNLVLGWNNGGQTVNPVPAIGGLVNITKIGTGTQNLFNANPFVGNILVAGGTLGSGNQQAAVDGSTSAFGCLTNAGKTIVITNSGTLSLTINNALLNGLTPDTLPPITVYSGGTLNATRFNALGQITLNGGTLFQNSSDVTPLNGYQFYTNVTVGGSAGATISMGANGNPDDLYNAANGGTTFNVANTASGGPDLTVSANLADYSNDGVTTLPGSLNKSGVGLMVCIGTNSYTGLTTVLNGELGFNSYSPQSGGIAVNDGAILDVTVAGTSQMVPSTLTLGSSAGATIQFIDLANTTTAPVIATNLTLNGTVTVNLEFPSIANGNQYPLITYTTIGGAGNLVLGPGRNGSSMNLVTNNNGNGTFTIALNVVNTGSATTDVWNGNNSGNWDFATANWTVGGVSGTYFDGDFVVFTNGTTRTNVTIATTVTPGSVTVNSANNYNFISSGGSHIAGSGGLTKGGAGTLTLAGLANTYAGNNVINGGTVSISADSNLGATTNGVLLNGGALSASASLTLNANRPLLLGPASGSGAGTLDVSAATNQMTYAGVVANNGAGIGSLTKTGPGTLNLTGANTYSGSTLVSNGKLSLTTAQQGGGAFTVSDNAALTVTVAGGATLPMAGLTLGASGNTTLTLQSATGTNAVINATNLVANGTVSVSVIGAAVKLGELPLIQYSTLSGSLANFSLAPTLPPNVAAVLTNDVSGKFIGLVITAINGLTWSGANGVNWDIATTTNWLYGTTNSIYSDGSAVLFNDTGSKNVTLATLVSPASVMVNASSVAYVFTPANASAGIGGPGGFTKLGLGTMSYASVTNSYAGVTVIGNGQITLGAHPATADPGQALLEFSTNSVIITNNAFLQLNGIGGGGTVWSQFMNNSITLDGGNVFATDGGQHLVGPITVGPNGACFGEQQTNKYLFLDGPVSGSGTITLPLPGGVNDGIHGPGGFGYGSVLFTCTTNPYSGTINLYNGNIAIDDFNGTALANATVNLLGFNSGLLNPIMWISNATHVVSIGGLAGTVPLNLTEPDGWYVSLTLSNNSASPLLYSGALSDSSASATVTKFGTGAEWLTGTNTYVGATMINGGELGISTRHAGNGSFTVADGAGLGVTNAGGAASALISGLTLGSSGPTTFEFQNVADTTTPVINCSGALTVNGPSTVVITGTNGLAAGNQYPLITATGGIGGTGRFALTVPSAVTANLVTNGNTIALNVTAITPPVNTNPTNIVVSVSGGNMTLSWPADHTGWRLQVQTNSLSVGIGTNWFTVAGSTNVNSVNVPVASTNGSVFYRLVYP